MELCIYSPTCLHGAHRDYFYLPFFISRFLLLLLKIQVLWDTMPFWLLNIYRRFKGKVASLLHSAFEISVRFTSQKSVTSQQRLRLSAVAKTISLFFNVKLWPFRHDIDNKFKILVQIGNELCNCSSPHHTSFCGLQAELRNLLLFISLQCK